jgi:hypothetical protein
METIISEFVKGFESIPPSKYPENSRMAVMNMSAHELDNPEMPIAVNAVFPLFKQMYKEIFPDISLNNFKNFMSAEPGYLRFVNANSVKNFKSVAKANTLEALLADKFISHQLCENEWFLPGQKNSSQTATCLGAAMQISGWVGIESGLMAVLQMVQKKSQPIFRKNAGAHIVFISDTHDPGNSSFNGYEEYLKKLPTFAILERKIRENSKDVSFVKLHGVVPFTVCDKSEESEKGIYGGSYLKPIEASGGVAVDMCKDEVNYSAVVNQLFDAARKIPPFRLKSSEIKNVSVKVNGQAHADFKIIDNRLVEVNGLLLSEDYSIQIQYDAL